MNTLKSASGNKLVAEPKGKIAMRKVRQESNETLKKEQKDGDITEDDLHRERDEIQKLTDKYCTQIDTIVDSKQKEIMEL